MDRKSLLNILSEVQKHHGFTDEQIAAARVGHTADSRLIVEVPIATRDFMRTVLIDEMRNVVKASPWLGSICMSSAIEFFGKCLDEKNPTSWDTSGTVRADFERAVSKLDSLKDYRIYLKAESNGKFDLYDEMRCGLIHCFAPKARLSLSHANGEKTNMRPDNTLNINVTTMVTDITKACEEVIAMKFEPNNKMEQPKIFVKHEITITSK